MKIKRKNLIQACLLAVLLLALPAAVQAQFTYTVTDGRVTITGYTGSGGAVTIPATIEGLPVTSIGEQAFAACQSLTSVTIPNSVTSIGDWAFNVCQSLTSVTIPNSVTSIGFAAFAYCTKLTSVMIPSSIMSIGDSTFADCTSLASVTISNGVTSIGDSTFADCTSLANVNIPSSVTSIGNAAFADCISLTSVTIPNSVTSIGHNAFLNCTYLISVFFQGNAPAPSNDTSVFEDDFAFDPATAYYLAGTTGWGTTFDGIPTELYTPYNPSTFESPLPLWANVSLVIMFYVIGKRGLERKQFVPALGT
jgi:hypothetical protein